jgi:ADP-heptose:LPS heptosyltransferase
VEKSMAWRQWSDRGLFLLSIGLSRFINGKKDPKSLKYKRILIFKEDEIGDLVNVTPALASLRKQYPAAEITLVTQRFGLNLLKHCPDINRVTDDYSSLTGRYDLLIDLRGTPKSTWFAIKKRPAIRLDRGSVRFRNRQNGKHRREIETNLQVIEPVVDACNIIHDPVLTVSDDERKEAENFLSSENIRKFALFHTGARRILKKWPLERVAEIMKVLHEQYGLEPVIVGDQTDSEDLEMLQPMVPFTIHQAAGKISLLTFAAMCERATIFIGNDSGPFHIAAAMGTRSLALFGPGDPVFHPHQANAALIHHILECNPCDMVHCKYKENPCIQRITTDEVSRKIKDMLTR